MKTREKKKTLPAIKSPMDAALHFLGYRARTVRETERHLDEKQYGEYEVAQTIDRLLELGLLDDEKFAADFIETRLNTKPVSRRHLGEQLYAHELSADVIAAALERVSDEEEQENASRIAEKYWQQFSSLEQRERQSRVMQRLLGRGYDYETARRALAAQPQEEGRTE